MHSANEALRNELEAARTKIDEMENGVDRRIVIIEELVGNREFQKAEMAISELLKIHPEAKSNPNVVHVADLVAKGTEAVRKLQKEEKERSEREAREAAERQKALELSRGLVVWQESFDRGFPIDFSATDPKRMYSILVDSAKFSKDRFESEAEFKARIKKETSARKLGAYGFGDTFVFRAEKKSYAPAVEYDASRKRFFLTLRESVSLHTEREERGGYVGSNALGVSAVVEKRDWDYWVLVLNNFHDIKRGRYEAPSEYSYVKNYADIIVPMSADEARGLDGKLGVLYLVKLAYPFAEFDVDHKKPTLSEPTELYHTTRKIYGNLSEVIVYRTDSGAILARSKVIR